MQKTARVILDCLIALYSLFSLYYIVQLLLHWNDILDFIYSNLSPGNSMNSAIMLTKFVLIAAIILAGHIVISIWMYADFSKRRFISDFQRTLWLAMLIAGFSPIYYFMIGRNSHQY
jgi:hypothetical protein